MTYSKKKEEIDTKLNNTEKTTETQPVGAIELDTVDTSIATNFTAARSPVLAVTSLSMMQIAQGWPLILIKKPILFWSK